jgi:hypothetical protein
MKILLSAILLVSAILAITLESANAHYEHIQETYNIQPIYRNFYTKIQENRVIDYVKCEEDDRVKEFVKENTETTKTA